jgi:hypothetical protein
VVSPQAAKAVEARAASIKVFLKTDMVTNGKWAVEGMDENSILQPDRYRSEEMQGDDAADEQPQAFLPFVSLYSFTQRLGIDCQAVPSLNCDQGHRRRCGSMANEARCK